MFPAEAGRQVRVEEDNLLTVKRSVCLSGSLAVTSVRGAHCFINVHVPQRQEGPTLTTHSFP